MKKRILALMLACFMIVSLLPMQVFAEETVTKCPGEGEDHAKENCTYVEERVVEPTCDDWGYTIYSCTGCGAHFVDDITEKRGEHEWVWQDYVPATCYEPGIVGNGWYCEICGENADEVLATIAPAHEFGDIVGNCLDAHRTCNVCGFVDNLARGEHCYYDENNNYNISTEINVPGNTDPNQCGIATYTCVFCGDTHEVVILHTLQFVPGVDGYCDHYECTTCEKTFSVKSVEGYTNNKGKWVPGYLEELNSNVKTLEQLPKLEIVDPYAHDYHNYVKTEVIVDEENCAPVIEVYTCTVCGHSYELEGKKNHLNAQYVAEIAPGCETYGLTYYFCNHCNEQYVVENDLPLGHNWTEWKPVVIACIEGKGQDMRECKRCGKVETRETDPVGHDKVYGLKIEATCIAQGYYHWTCAVCDEVGVDIQPINPNGHYREDLPLSVVEPTCTEEGWEFYFCPWCDQNYEIRLDPLGHDGLHTVVYKSCHATETTIYCDSCDYYEYSYVVNEREVDSILVYEAEVTKEEIEAEHTLYFTETIEYRNAETEVISWTNLGAYYEGRKDPTCGKFGYDEYYCALCEEDFIHIIPATGEHRFEGELQSFVVNAATPTPGKAYADANYAVDFKGGYFEITLEFDVWGFEVMFYDAEGNVMDNYTAETDYMTYITFIFEDVEFASMYLVVTQGVVTVTPYLKSDVFPAADCNADDGKKNEGWDEHQYCIDCRQMVGGKEHKWEPVGPAKEPTCTETGLIAGWECKDCNKYFIYDEENDVYYEVETLVIPALGHDLMVNYHVVVEDDWQSIYFDERKLEHSDNGELFAYTHYVCANGCGFEYIGDYHNGVAHTWNYSHTVDPTCTENGGDYYVCDCGAERIDVIPALGHVYGAPSDTYCGKCEVCGFELIHNSELEVEMVDGVLYFVVNGEYVLEIVASMPATCSTGAYDLHHCYMCEYEWAVTTSEAVSPEDEVAYFNSHVWGESVEILDVNGHGTGIWETACTLCGYIHTAHENAYVNYIVVPQEGTYVAGSTINVEIHLDAKYVDVWGFDLDLYFNDEGLTFVGYSYNTEKFDYLVGANHNVVVDGFDYISIAATAADNAVIVNEAVITLTFVANECYGYADLLLIPQNTRDIDGNYIPAVNFEDDSASIRINRIMDMDGDWDIDLEDLRLCYLHIINPDAEYNVIADADRDGDVDIDDLQAIYHFILND